MHFQRLVIHIPGDAGLGLQFKQFGGINRTRRSAPLTTRCAPRTSPSTRACSEMTSMLVSAGSAITLPLTWPSIRRPPLKRRLPSMLVDIPIRLSIVFFAFVAEHEWLSFTCLADCCARNLSFFEHPRPAHVLTVRAFRQGQYAFNPLIMLEFKFELAQACPRLPGKASMAALADCCTASDELPGCR